MCQALLQVLEYRHEWGTTHIHKKLTVSCSFSIFTHQILILSIYWVFIAVWVTEDTEMNRVDVVPAFVKFTVSR